jgi:hypothetical protein
MPQSKVADLTLNEFKKLIRETVKQTLKEIFTDPDEELELRDDFRRALERSLTEADAGGKTRPASDVAADLGLDW